MNYEENYDNEWAALKILHMVEDTYILPKGPNCEKKFRWVSYKRYCAWEIIEKILCEPGRSVVDLIGDFELEMMLLRTGGKEPNVFDAAYEVSEEILDLLSDISESELCD